MSLQAFYCSGYRESPHQQSERIKQTVPEYLGTVKVQTGLNLTTWKNHSCQSCYPVFLLKQNKKKTKKNWKQGVNMAQDEKIVFNWKWTFNNEFQDVYRSMAWTDFQITREHCGPSGAAQELQAVRHTSHQDGVIAGLPICHTALPCWHHFCLFFSSKIKTPSKLKFPWGFKTKKVNAATHSCSWIWKVQWFEHWHCGHCKLWLSLNR